MGKSVNDAAIALRRRMAHQAKKDGAPLSRIAEALGVSPSTAGRDVKVAEHEQDEIAMWVASSGVSDG
jgi:IS30 family transposase